MFLRQDNLPSMSRIGAQRIHSVETAVRPVTKGKLDGHART
jgi:hypothetical protein